MKSRRCHVQFALSKLPCPAPRSFQINLGLPQNQLAQSAPDE